jgi:antitoxin PrlF
MKTYKITSNFRITIPENIRDLLNIKIGDLITFKITKKKTIVIKRAASFFDTAFLKNLEPSLSEWNSENDNEDYKDL